MLTFFFCFSQVLVEKMGLPGGKNGLSLDPSDTLGCCKWWNNVAKRIATLEFDRMRKSMGVIVRTSSGSNALLVKVLIPLFLVTHFWRTSICIQRFSCTSLPLL
jgi:hypothetical protein